MKPSDDTATVGGALEGAVDHVTILRRRAAAAARAREALDAAIVEARRAGVSLRTIGDAAGISYEDVRRRVAAAEAAGQ